MAAFKCIGTDTYISVTGAGKITACRKLLHEFTFFQSVSYVICTLSESQNLKKSKSNIQLNVIDCNKQIYDADDLKVFIAISLSVSVDNRLIFLAHTHAIHFHNKGIWTATLLFLQGVLLLKFDHQLLKGKLNPTFVKSGYLHNVVEYTWRQIVQETEGVLIRHRDSRSTRWRISTRLTANSVYVLIQSMYNLRLRYSVLSLAQHNLNHVFLWTC